MKWILLACANFFVANVLIAVLITFQSVDRFSLNNNWISFVHYGSSQHEILNVFGSPHLKINHKWIYKTSEESSFEVYWENDKLVSANVVFSEFVPLKDIYDIKYEKFVVVKDKTSNKKNGWVQIGIPKKGAIVSINKNGDVSGVEWRTSWVDKSSDTLATVLSAINDLPPYAYSKSSR